MDLHLKIFELKSAEHSKKSELYESIMKSIYDLQIMGSPKMNEKDLELLLSEISKDLLDENQPFVESILKLLKLLLASDDTTKCFLSEGLKRNIVKSVVSIMKVNHDDQVLLLCFEHLDGLLLTVKLADDVAAEILNKISEIANKRSVSVELYLAVCNYIQKFFIEYKGKLADIMHIVPKLIFPPLSHNVSKVREIAEKTLDDFPKLLLYAENEAVSSALMKLIKDTYCKDLLVLFKEKHEVYVLKVWKHIVNTLGKSLHNNLTMMTPLFKLIENAFKSTCEDVCETAFLSWKCLISNFALDEAVLNDSKKLRFVLKPFKNLSKSSETLLQAVCDTWWHLAWSLSSNLSSHFTEVCLPLLEFTIRKISAGPIEKAVPKATQVFLAKRGIHLLLRLLEQPPNAAFNRISSPKKLPSMLYPALQVAIDPKVIIRHSNEIISMVRTTIETFGISKEMTSQLESLLKSVLFMVSTVIEDRSKESKEAVTLLINLVSDITESQKCPPLTCLKCIDSLSKLPRSILVSHCFNCGPRKPQDILCTTLLKLLFNPYLFAMETPNRKFLMAYNRLIQAGLCESLNPLLMTHKYIHIVKSSALPQNTETELLYEIWSGIASPLLESIEKTQEVNQGDKQDHDFSCLYDVLLCPFEHNFPIPVHQFRTKPAFRLWTNLYKTFIRSSSLVTTVLPNEACEQFCARLKNYLNEDLLKEPHYFEVVCFLLEVVIDSVDFASVGTSNSQGFTHGSLLVKRKKPLGNSTSLVDLLTLQLNLFYSNYVNVDEDIYHSCTPKAQRKSHISKQCVPFDLVKTFLGNLKSRSIIPVVLEELVPALSKFFIVNQKKCSNGLGTKLEDLWNAVASCIEIHYLGPYDSDFLTVMNPLLELCISHPRRLVKERSRRFWFATFAPSASSLKMPDSLKTVLKKSKLSLAPEESISPLEEFSFTPDSASLENGVTNFESAVSFKEPFLKPFVVVLPKETKTPEPKPMKTSKASTKKSVDELPSDKFVKIDSPGPSSLTPRRQSIRHKKSFVPALYNDLSQSQDTTTLGGSSESFDTSSSCEIIEFKSQKVCTTETATLSEKQTELLDEEALLTISSEKNSEVQQIDSLEIITDAGAIANFSKNVCNNLSEILIENEVQVNDKNRKVTLQVDNENEMDIEQINDENEMDIEQVNDKNEMYIEKISDKSEMDNEQINNKTMDILKINDKNDKSVQLSAFEVSNSQELANNPNLEYLNAESDVKESIEEIIVKVSTVSKSLPASASVNSKNLVHVRQKKRNADEKSSLHAKNVKRKSLLNICTEPIKPEDTKKNITSFTESPKFSEMPENKKDVIDNCVQEYLGETVMAKPRVKIYKVKPVKVLKKKCSESFSFETSEKLFDQLAAFKANQTCPEVIDISDSEEIIPSSQSSVDSATYKKPQTPEIITKKSRRSLKFDNFEEKTGASKTFNSITTSSDLNTFPVEAIPMNVEEVNETECPETQLDLMEAIEEATAAVSKESTSISKDSEPMPLKSSENLLSCEDLNNKPENDEVKSALSTVLQINKKNKLNIAENTPPYCEDVCVLQNTAQVSFQSEASMDEVEEKPTPKLSDSESKLKKIELKLPISSEKDESPKTVRVKSLRSAGKGSSRKSIDSVMVKKSGKRTAKRKSMPCASAMKKVKCNTLEAISETVSSNFDMEIDYSVPSSNSSSELGKDSQEEILHVDKPSKMVNSQEEESSLMMDINIVISDMKIQLETYEENNTIDFGANEEKSKLPVIENNFKLPSVEEPESNGKVSEIVESVKLKEEDISSVSSESSIKRSTDSPPKTDAEKELIIPVGVEIDTFRAVDIRLKTSNVLSEVYQPLLSVSESSKPSVTKHSICSDSPPDTAKANGGPNQDTQVNVIKTELNNKPSLDKDNPINELDVFEKEQVQEKSKISMTSINKSADGCSSPKEIIHDKNSDSLYQQVNITTEKSLSNSQESNSSEDVLHDNNLLEEETINEVVTHKSSEVIKDILDNFNNQDILVCPSELNNPSFNKYEDDINKQEHCIGGIAAYEEIVENPGNAYPEESPENFNFEESAEQSSQNAETQNLSNVKSMEHNGYEALSNESEIELIDNSPDLELKNVGKNPVIQNSVEITENGECLYDDTHDLLLVVSSETDFTENLVEISDSASDICVSISEDVDIDASDTFNGSLPDVDMDASDTFNGSLPDVDMIRDTPSLLTSETFENDSDNKSDDQISVVEESDDKKVANCSRKRKANRPVRSPFVFRQRPSITMAKNLLANSNSISMDEEDCKISTKQLPQNVSKQLAEYRAKKQKTESKAPELPNEPEGTRLISQACGKAVVSSKVIKKATETAKPPKVVNYKELTNLNTRLNASITLQTRRCKQIAASQKAGLSVENQSLPNDENDVDSEEDSSTSKPSNGILKKRKASSDLSSPKLRKVTFADPLFEERLFKNNDSLGKCILKNDFLVITKEQQNNNSSEDIAKITKDILTKVITYSSSSEEITSSNEYQDSDNLTDYSSSPVCPMLIKCEDSVSSILKGLTSPAWVIGLEALLLSKNIKTIGDLCKLNVHEIKALPFKSPKVTCLHKALEAHLSHTNKSTLEKIIAIDDWCSDLVSSDNPGKDTDSHHEEAASENIEPEILQSWAEGLNHEERLDALPTATLISLATKCFTAVTKRVT